MEPREVLKRLDEASWDDDLWCHPELVDEVEAIVEENERLRASIFEMYCTYCIGSTGRLDALFEGAMRDFKIPVPTCDEWAKISERIEGHG